MSQQIRVTNKLNLQSFINILSRPRARTSIDAHCAAPRKFSIESEGALTRVPTDIEVPSPSNSATFTLKKKSLVATERALKRKSFFEHICGVSGSGLEAESTSLSGSQQSGLKNVNKYKLKDNLQTKDTVTSNRFLRKYIDPHIMSITTCDDSLADISNNSDSQEYSNQFFIGFKIKKTSLAKKRLLKFEFVPLTDCEEFESRSDALAAGRTALCGDRKLSDELTQLLADSMNLDDSCIDLEGSIFKMGTEVDYKCY